MANTTTMKLSDSDLLCLLDALDGLAADHQDRPANLARIQSLRIRTGEARLRTL